MEPVYYTVDSIDGDYAYMTSDNGVKNQVAMFLLPEGTTKAFSFAVICVKLAKRISAFVLGKLHGKMTG